MADERRKSKSIIPPSHAPGLDLRTWLAGCAMANSNIVTATSLPEAMEQALHAADTLMAALQNRSPTQESIKSPTTVQLDRWEKNLELEKELRSKETIPAIRRQPKLTPAEGHFAEATETLRRASETNVSAVRPPERTSPVPKSPGFYSVRVRPSSNH